MWRWVRGISIVVVAALAFGAGYAARGWTDQARATDATAHYAGFNVFWEAWDLVRERYVEPEQADPQHLTYGAIAGMVASLGDQGHTRFLTPQELERWQQSLAGDLVGIGIEVHLRDGRPVIIAPLTGSPAEQAGIRAGDVIIEVDGKDTAGLSLEDLATLLRGPEGSTVTLTLRHPGAADLYTVTVTRTRIELPTVTWTMAPGTAVAMVRISQFSEGTHSDLVTALRQARQAGAQGMVLDLRNNPGGLFDEALDVASEFLDGGVVVKLKDRSGATSDYDDRNGKAGAATTIPLVVLVNEGSASSSEIVAGAIQDHQRATIVGEHTVGTGTVLNTFRLSDGSAILLGTALWLTPNGHMIRDGGIKPDISVALAPEVTPLRPTELSALSPEQLAASQDAQLLKALELLGAQPAEKAA